MFLVLILLPVVAVAAADWLHYRRRVHALAPWRRRLFVAWCCATDALPVLLLLAGLLLPDNPTALVRAMMWGVWVWMLAAVPRGVCYLFSLVGLRRAGWGAGLAAAALLVWGATG
ncbi:MAG TPA: phosphohydrolase, partial [Alistipes sp.]|nr:phosphohydrolase [Alistipes sp.]